MKRRFLASVVTLLLSAGVVVLGAGAAQAAPSDGTRDVDYAPIGIDGVEVYATALDTQGRLVVAGDFRTAEGVNRGNIARYLADGTLDTSFAAGAGFDGAVHSLAIDRDGNVLVGGGFSTYDGAPAVRIARLTPSGALDATFATGAGFDSIVLTVAVDAAGGVIAGGEFTAYGSTPLQRIARLTPAGALDTAFTTSSGFDSTVRSLAVDGGGAVVAGGSFAAYRGSPARGIARLTPTGTLDGTFTTGTGFDASVRAVAIDRDGSVLAGGSFTTFRGSTARGIARLTPTGTLDGTFTTGAGFNSLVIGLAVDSAGHVLVGGDFTSYDGATAPRIARLTPAGALDTTFVTGTGFNYAVNLLTPDPNGNVLVAGDFNDYDGSWAGLVARLSAPVSLTYDVNGGTGTAPATQSTLSGRSVTVAAGTGITRPGFTFAGWNTVAGGTGTARAAGVTFAATDTTTLYAQWTAVPVSGGPTTTGAPVGTGPVLADTGNDDAVPLTALGGVLLLTGTGALLVARRRSS